jgi:autotransporter-associated beta strand protein
VGVAVTLMAICGSGPAMADIVIWTGGFMDGTWSSGGTGQNWYDATTSTFNVVPGAGDVALFDYTDSSYNGYPTYLPVVTVGGPQAVGQLKFDNTLTLAATPSLTIGPDSTTIPDSLAISGISGVNGNVGILNNAAVAITISAPLALQNSQIWTNNSAIALTVSGVVSGTANLTINGTGVTVLSGTNSYVGSTTISGGTLSISNDNNFRSPDMAVKVSGV